MEKTWGTNLEPFYESIFKMISLGIPLESAHERALSYILASQKLRVPLASKKIVSEIKNAFLYNETGDYLNDVQDINELKQEFFYDQRPISKSEALLKLKEEGKESLSIKVSHGAYIQFIIDRTLSLADEYLLNGWFFVVSPNKRLFTVSDNPIIKIDKNEIPFLTSDFEFMPINEKIGIVIGLHLDEYVKLDTKHVKLLNKKMVSNSSSFVISSSKPLLENLINRYLN